MESSDCVIPPVEDWGPFIVYCRSLLKRRDLPINKLMNRSFWKKWHFSICYLRFFIVNKLNKKLFGPKTFSYLSYKEGKKRVLVAIPFLNRVLFRLWSPPFLFLHVISYFTCKALQNPLIFVLHFFVRHIFIERRRSGVGKHNFLLCFVIFLM